MSGAREVSLGISGEQVPVGSHIAYMWETPEEFERGVRFLEVGLRDGDHCVIFGFEEACGEVCTVLGDRGHDLTALQAEGRVSIVNGCEEGELMLSRIGEVFQRAIDGGASLIRLLGNIGWGRPGWPEESEILAFEAKVTGAAALFPCVVVCMYHVPSLSGEIVLHGAFRTHPLTICGTNLVRVNPNYVPVGEFLSELDGRRTARPLGRRGPPRARESKG
jgi:hypothetical protein